MKQDMSRVRRYAAMVLAVLAMAHVVLTIPAASVEPEQQQGKNEQPAASPPAAAAGDAAAPATPAPQPAPPPEPVLTAAEQAAIEEARAPALNLRTAIESLEKSVERNRENDAALADTRAELDGLIEAADLTWNALGPRLEAINKQIQQLGPPPAKDAPPESEQVAKDRARLNTLAAELSGAMKTTELVKVRAGQLYSEVQRLRQSIFAGQILRRSPSPLSPATWEQLGSEIAGAGRQIGYAIKAWLRHANERTLELSGLAIAVSLIFLALAALVRSFLAYRLPNDRDPPPAFFEQAATAGWVAPVLALPAATSLALFGLGLDAIGLLTGAVGDIAVSAVPALAIALAASALARAILQPKRSAWRLVDLDDRPARVLTLTLTRIAAVYAADIVLQEMIRRLYLPLSISVMETAIASIAIATLLIMLVRTPFDPKPERVAPSLDNLDRDAEPQGFPPPRTRLLSEPRLIKIPLLVLAAAILGLSLTGYIGLGRFLASQVVVTGSAIALVLLLHLAIRALLGGPGTGMRPMDKMLEEKAGLSSVQAGAAVQAVSIILNATLALLAIPLVLLTWGYSTAEALAWLQAAIFGFEVGQFRISFARILLAVLLFLALLLMTRLAQRWLDGGILKAQSIDKGIAHSIHTGVGYAGFLVAALVAISYGGLDITNFAIVAGALSVGIGFGLQSIVNNFVSGLILLVERPIKVGDWVVVKEQQGFVRRIAVRSTEIETFDRASLIVPNSDLITSMVTNRTHRNALGRIVINVGVSYRSDPDQVIAILEKVAKECPLLMQHPAPVVWFDNFGSSALEFSLRAVVHDVMQSGAAQTELRLRIFRAFRDAGIEVPFPQHDVHLRDLDVVRQIVARLADERRAKERTDTRDPDDDG